MNKIDARKRRGKKTKAIIRKSERPRLVVFRSANHIYSQVIVSGENGDTVIAASSTLDKECKPDTSGNKTEQAKRVGALLAKRALKNQLSEVAFDRCGYKYHGRIKALADAAREAGLKF